MFGIFRRWRRKRLREKPLPDAWWSLLDRNVPYLKRLPPADREQLGGIVRILLDEKRFEGCGGLEMTDEIRLTIAAQAAVLLLHRGPDCGYYPSLKTVLVYPHGYVASGERVAADGTVRSGRHARAGESWYRGPVVLSWSDALQGAADARDGHNVVFHEFAHQLDAESGALEGAPDLGTPARFREWARVLRQDYAELVDETVRGHRTLIDGYGAESPAEFFAVVTEHFFEKPRRLREEHPDLYRQFARFYRQDPAAGAAG